ncbi:MAG: hypothetical protein ABSE53_08470 [Terracidiphilus sp.]
MREETQAVKVAAQRKSDPILAPPSFPFLIGEFSRRQPSRWSLRLGSKFSSRLFADECYRRVVQLHLFASADPASFIEMSRNQGFCR